MKRLVILPAVVTMLTFMASWGGQAQAAPCTFTITAATSIQTTIDGAVSGDVVCLSDMGGDFSQTVIFSGTDAGDDDSGITLTAVAGETPVLDGTTGSLADAITLQDGVRRVTIEDLEIRNYTNQAIRGVGMTAMPLSRISLRNLDIHDIYFHAIDILFSQRVWIEDVAIRIGAGANFFAEAIRLQSVDRVTVDNVAIVGGFVGVNFACSGACSGPEPPTNGTIINSTICSTTDNGVLIANSTNARVEWNVIAGAGFGGIQIGFRKANPVTGARVFGNVVTGTNGDGILLTRGSSGNHVLNNTVTGSTGGGIVVVEKNSTPPPPKPVPLPAI